MKNKAEIINRIIQEVGGENYAEIGYGDGANFKQIKSHYKASCDPNYKGNDHACHKGDSDSFFEANKETQIDVIFIDGLHHADQVRKDIINALKCNAKAIILHDTIPPTEAHQIVPRKQTSWTGDCWRAVVGFKQSYPDVKLETYRSDYGLTVIFPEGKKVKKHFENKEMTYDEFKENEVKLLNIID